MEEDELGQSRVLGKTVMENNDGSPAEGTNGAGVRVSAEKDPTLAVKVALNVRPLIGLERVQGCKDCITVVSGEPQVRVAPRCLCVFQPLLRPWSTEKRMGDSSGGIICRQGTQSSERNSNFPSAVLLLKTSP